MAHLRLETPPIALKAKTKPEIESTEPDTPLQEVAEFIDCVLTAAIIVHKMHLRVTGPGSFAAHKALNELYDALPDHGDDIAEAYQGYRGVILPNVAEVDQMTYLSMGHLEYVEFLIKDIEEERSCFGNVSPIQNKVDELLGTLYSARYKLKFLS
jgi:DNA-binding ferritin-like protein